MDPATKHFLEYIKLCERIYHRKVREGSWPFPDSPKDEDLLESGDS